jgi:hypothetical protein
MNIPRYIVRRTSYGYVAYDLDAKCNVGIAIRSKASVARKVASLNGTAK